MTRPKAEPDPRKTRPGKDEMNLAEFPITALTETVPKDVKTLEFHDTVTHGKQTTARKVTISGSDLYGLPTPLDDEVLLGLICLTKVKNNFTEPTVCFSRSEVLRLLNWRIEGFSYRRLETSLKKWVGVTLYYEKAWWDKEKQSWVSVDFHILEDVKLYDTERKQGEKQISLTLSSFTWNSTFFKNLQAGNVRTLDLNFYLNLHHPISRRLYRFLDKHFYHAAELKYELLDLAFAHVGLTKKAYVKKNGSVHVGLVKQKMTPGIEELERCDYLEPLAPEKRFQKCDNEHWAFFRRKKQQLEVAEETKGSAPNQLEQSLADRGVTAATAAEIAASFEVALIRSKTEVFDWLVEKKDKRVSTNPAGYLVESIRKDYKEPKGFVPKAERERKALELSEQRKKREEASKRREDEEEAKWQAERAPVEDYLRSLSDTERTKLEAEALRTASPKDLRFLKEHQEGGLFADAMKRTIVEKHVKALLAAEQRAGCAERPG